jgi:hypothetical protein
MTTSECRLSWRIPTGGDPRLLRFRLAQVGLATIVAALVLCVAAPRGWLGWALAGLLPLAVFVAYRRWRDYHQSQTGPDNVRLDGTGLHWQDAGGQERSFSRQSVTGFRIGREEDTLRPLPALTLLLAGGFESQPLELHPPASEDAIRQLLCETWGVEERPATNAQSLGYDRALDVYSECHDDYQEWHWEGTREQLGEFFHSLRTAADELPPPPIGAKPAQRVILCRHPEPVRLRIAHSPTAHFDHDLLAAPADVLRQIAAAAGEKLEAAATPSDHKFDVRLGVKNNWTFHLHVRGENRGALPMLFNPEPEATAFRGTPSPPAPG